MAVVDTCGFTPPTRTFQSSIRSGQRELAGEWIEEVFEPERLCDEFLVNQKVVGALCYLRTTK